jgi:Predicted dioxygenase
MNDINAFVCHLIGTFKDIHDNKGRGRDAVNWVRYENDRRIVELMLDLEPEKVISESLNNRNACCGGAAAAAIAAVKKTGGNRIRISCLCNKL